MSTQKTATVKKVRIFLVDDHPIVRRGFQFMFALDPKMMVCGEAEDGPEAMQKTAISHEFLNIATPASVFRAGSTFGF